MTTSALELPKLPSSLQFIVTAIETEQQMNTNRLAEIILEAKVQTDDLKPWSTFDHPAQDSYGRMLIHNGGFFEIMAMSWCPGDFSAIHDHGYTQWGCVQVYGNAEHSVFKLNDGKLRTVLRENVSPGSLLKVNHDLVHQLGNPVPEQFFYSLHIYGTPEQNPNITGDARVFDLEKKQILRVDGGMFYALPDDQIKRRETILEPDFMTWLRDRVELIKRVRRAQSAGRLLDRDLDQLIQECFSSKNWDWLMEDVNKFIDSEGCVTSVSSWKLIIWELRKFAELYDSLERTHDHKQKLMSVAQKLNNWMDTILNLDNANTETGTGAPVLFDIQQWDALKNLLLGIVNETRHVQDFNTWHDLREKLIRIAALQFNALIKDQKEEDRFHTYAELYDEIIGKPCLNDFMKQYFSFFIQKFGVDITTSSFLSIGCGTGVVEEHLLEIYQIPYENMLGVDISEAMVKEASRHIHAKACDFLEMEETSQWDITFTGLNVFQYMPSTMLDAAIEKSARLTKQGGYFIGDFITTDHVRWYPNVLFEEDVISLRNPRLVEKDQRMYQESEIINLSKMKGELRITYEGKHLRYLAPLQKIRKSFEKHFGANIQIYDAVTLDLLHADAETCPSTRYLVIAPKTTE
ncbi:MAG: methyltransferase domain-containing protein [SAR324 cluster bacterium]|nr:methyltransferase domain-containing protein [SAR324 cluster bacterium]